MRTLFPALLSIYKERTEKNANIAFPVIKNVYENQSNQFERIVIPFTDGQKE